jgi:hypothetical protein
VRDNVICEVLLRLGVHCAAARLPNAVPDAPDGPANGVVLWQYIRPCDTGGPIRIGRGLIAISSIWCANLEMSPALYAHVPATFSSFHVTRVAALGSACVSQDCAIGRSGKSLDVSWADSLSLPIPGKRRNCPTQQSFAGNQRRERRVGDASRVTVFRSALQMTRLLRPTRDSTGDCRPTPAEVTLRSCHSARAESRRSDARSAPSAMTGLTEFSGMWFLHANLLRGTHST